MSKHSTAAHRLSQGHEGHQAQRHSTAARSLTAAAGPRCWHTCRTIPCVHTMQQCCALPSRQIVRAAQPQDAGSTRAQPKGRLHHSAVLTQEDSNAKQAHHRAMGSLNIHCSHASQATDTSMASCRPAQGTCHETCPRITCPRITCPRAFQATAHLQSDHALASPVQVHMLLSAPLGAHVARRPQAA